MFKPLRLLLSASQERKRIKRNERNVAEKEGGGAAGGGGILKQMGENEHEVSGEPEKGRAAGCRNIKLS